MVDPLEELIRQSTEFHDRLIQENNEIDRAFQSGALGSLIQSWSSDDDGNADELAGEAGEDVLGGEDRGESRESETGEETV